jgi:acetyltransferase-like isoleucine patch superfamily enzyme
LLRLNHVHATVRFGGYSDISRDFRAEAYVYVGPGCLIGPGVEVGCYSMLGPDVKIVGNDHVFDRPGVPITFSGRPAFRRTTIGRDVWIGGGAIILRGTTIGDGAIVAAGAVVTRDVAPMTIVGGIPARVIRRRFEDAVEEAAHTRMLQSPAVVGDYCRPLKGRLVEGA